VRTKKTAAPSRRKPKPRRPAANESTESLRAEMKRLRRELAAAHEDNAILRKLSSYFAREALSGAAGGDG